jgi:ABC-type polysaccharide/polyol phosphate export permease
VAANLANFLLSLAVLLPILYGFTEVKPSLTLLHLPFIIIINTLFLLGLCLITSITNVIYRDTTQIMEFLVFVWFYLSPVLYDIYNMFEDFGASTKWAAILYFLNPMAGILEWYRYSLLSSKFMVGAPADGQIKTVNTIMFQFGIPYAVICSLLLVVFGYLFMKRLETRAVDEL